MRQGDAVDFDVVAETVTAVVVTINELQCRQRYAGTRHAEGDTQTAVRFGHVYGRRTCKDLKVYTAAGRDDAVGERLGDAEIRNRTRQIFARKIGGRRDCRIGNVQRLRRTVRVRHVQKGEPGDRFAARIGGLHAADGHTVEITGVDAHRRNAYGHVDGFTVDVAGNVHRLTFGTREIIISNHFVFRRENFAGTVDVSHVERQARLVEGLADSVGGLRGIGRDRDGSRLSDRHVMTVPVGVGKGHCVLFGHTRTKGSTRIVRQSEPLFDGNRGNLTVGNLPSAVAVDTYAKGAVAAIPRNETCQARSFRITLGKRFAVDENIVVHVRPTRVRAIDPTAGVIVQTRPLLPCDIPFTAKTVTGRQPNGDAGVVCITLRRRLPIGIGFDVGTVFFVIPVDGNDITVCRRAIACRSRFYI